MWLWRCAAFCLQVRVLVPNGKGGRLEVAVLGRGQFVGERSVINDKLRSADCVAQGRVQVGLRGWHLPLFWRQGC